MKKLSLAFVLVLFVVGCGTQNENLAKGKELIKSDKRRKEERAVREFKLCTPTADRYCRSPTICLDFTIPRNFTNPTPLIGRRHRSPSAADTCSSHIKTNPVNISKD